MKKISCLFLFALSSIFLFAQQSVTSWSIKQQQGADGVVELIFNVAINSPWYMYSTNPGGDAIPTSIEFKKGNDYTLIGAFTELTPTETKFDEGVNAEVKIFHNAASFVQKIKPNAEAFTVSGAIEFQTCNGSSCRLGEEEFNINVTAAVTSTSSAIQQDTQLTVDNENPATDTLVAEAAETDTERTADSGLWLFLLIALGAGLGAVFTPCVFPMIPMTVSFFLGGKQSSRAAVIRGLIFGASVTLIYTSIGVLAALFKSASAVDVFSTHWIPNLIFALAFFIFALSFFGGYEITLPTGLANKADQKADSSGYLGSFFVAVALTIVSFSCTGPFVGGILVESMRSGLAVKPILGMAAFGFALAFPFMLFAVSPSLMKKMPKSGGWLNMVKVIFAFVLLAFSLKFLLMFGQYFGWTLISREVFIAIWIVCAVMLGFYFLGRLRLSHDSEVQHVGVVRLLFAMASFTFALYLLPGLLGASLPAMSGIIPDPKEPSVFAVSTVSPDAATAAYNQGLCGEVKYANPKHQLSYGLPAYHDIAQAIECAKQQNKPVLLAFKFDGCSECKKMEATVWSDERVLGILRNKVVIATLYIDDKTELPENEWVTSTFDNKVYKTLGGKLRDYQVAYFGVMAQPFYALIGFDEKPLTKPVAKCSTDEFLQFLNSGIEAFGKK
ncbi:MAG: thioredoxin family protein [Prevotellaceae bacterium]|jgi:thiol:disulfide interchange protein DsbD|nr:thioredoxin family protein [Prevotellaceae bacterium]